MWNILLSRFSMLTSSVSRSSVSTPYDTLCPDFTYSRSDFFLSDDLHSVCGVSSLADMVYLLLKFLLFSLCLTFTLTTSSSIFCFKTVLS